MTRHKIKADICHIFLKHQQVTNSDTEVAFISNILRKTTEVTGTGKSLLEALIFASTNPQYDNRLFIELQVQHTGYALGIWICRRSLLYKRELWASKSAGAHM